MRNAGLQRAFTRRADVHGCGVRTPSEEKEFFAVVAPARLESASRRNLDSRCCLRISLSVDLKSARFIRGVRDPFSIRRESPLHVNERRTHNRLRFLLATH